MDPSMTSPDRDGVQITHVHSEAICAEVAERLRPVLTTNSTGVPPDLLELAKRLDSAERGDTSFEN
jgi:hypothetical protein